MDIQKLEKFEDWFATRYPNVQKTIDLHNDHESIVFRNNQAEAWQAAKAQALPEWISVEDKLPSDDIGRVLAWVVEQNSLGKCGFAWNCSHSNGVFSDKFETFQVTHWMPLPDAPQEPTND